MAWGVDEPARQRALELASTGPAHADPLGPREECADACWQIPAGAKR